MWTCPRTSLTSCWRLLLCGHGSWQTYFLTIKFWSHFARIITLRSAFWSTQFYSSKLSPEINSGCRSGFLIFNIFPGACPPTPLTLLHAFNAHHSTIPVLKLRGRFSVFLAKSHTHPCQSLLLVSYLRWSGLGHQPTTLWCPTLGWLSL